MLEATDVKKRFGGLEVLQGISLTVAPGERRALIGPNGAGKTTLLNILSGLERPTSGRITYAGTDITGMAPHERARCGLGRTFQIASLFDDHSVRQNLLFALIVRERRHRDIRRPLHADTVLQEEADGLVDRWGLAGRALVPVKELSYGERRILEVVMALVGRPSLLLLDEPAAGLSGDETKAIVRAIGRVDPDIAMLVVEHDMDVVFSVCDRVTVLAEGQILADGSGEEVRRSKVVAEAYLGVQL